MGRATSAIIALALAAGVQLGPAAADDEGGSDQERAAELYELGAKLFQAKQYAEAAKLFGDSYELDPLPAALFNQARCLEESGQSEAAAAAFRSYLEADPDGPGATEAESRLLALERELEAQRREREAAAASERARPPTTAEPVVVDRGRSLRIAGYASAGAGVAMTIAGVAFGARASRLSDELEIPKDQWTDDDLDKVDSGRFAERMQVGLLIAGSAALVTGAVLAAIGHQRSAIEISPAVSKDTTGAAVTVRF